jgi:hypothetical protein
LSGTSPGRSLRPYRSRRGRYPRKQLQPARCPDPLRSYTKSADNQPATRCAGTDEGNPRTCYVGIRVMIPDPRARQPREEKMKCGNQPADIRMINRRSHPRTSRCSLAVRPYKTSAPKRPSLDAKKYPCLRLTFTAISAGQNQRPSAGRSLLAQNTRFRGNVTKERRPRLRWPSGGRLQRAPVNTMKDAFDTGLPKRIQAADERAYAMISERRNSRSEASIRETRCFLPDCAALPTNWTNHIDCRTAHTPNFVRP